MYMYIKKMGVYLYTEDDDFDDLSSIIDGKLNTLFEAYNTDMYDIYVMSCRCASSHIIKDVVCRRNLFYVDLGDATVEDIFVDMHNYDKVMLFMSLEYYDSFQNILEDAFSANKIINAYGFLESGLPVVFKHI